MTTDTRVINFVQTTDAEFRTWIAAILDQLNDIGLTQTSDTGQVDTATVTRSGSVNTATGYAIFRFNDSAHSTTPIFIKLEFGTGNPVTQTSMWITIGSSTDGAGTITGTTYRPRAQVSWSGTGPGTSAACYNASEGVLWAHWVQSLGGGSASATFFVERFKNRNTGEVSTEGLVSIWNGTAASNTVAHVHVIGYPSVTTTNLWGWPNVPSSSTPDFANNTVSTVMAARVFGVSKWYALIGVVGCLAGRWLHGTTIFVTQFTTQRQYRAQTLVGSMTGLDPAADTDGRNLMLWE